MSDAKLEEDDNSHNQCLSGLIIPRENFVVCKTNGVDLKGLCSCKLQFCIRDPLCHRVEIEVVADVLSAGSHSLLEYFCKFFKATLPASNLFWMETGHIAVVRPDLNAPVSGLMTGRTAVILPKHCLTCKWIFLETAPLVSG